MFKDLEHSIRWMREDLEIEFEEIFDTVTIKMIITTPFNRIRRELRDIVYAYESEANKVYFANCDILRHLDAGTVVQNKYIRVFDYEENYMDNYVLEIKTGKLKHYSLIAPKDALLEKGVDYV